MKRHLLLSIAFLPLALLSLAQKPTKMERTKADLFPTWIAFNEKDAPAFKAGQLLLIDPQDRSSFTSAAKLITKEKDQIGYEHHRMQQVYNNIPVEHATYIAHVKNGKLISQNGDWVKDFPKSLPTAATITEATALQKAMDFVGAKSYKWQDPAEEAFLKIEQNDPKASFKPVGQLVYYSGQQQVDGPSLKLAYKFDVYAAEPLSRKIIYIDASTGAILGFNDLIHEADTPATASTGYSGTKTISTELYAGTYRLREAGRGNGIQTYNLKNKQTYNIAVDFTNSSTTWNYASKDKYALDAHYGAEMTYDFYKNNFSRNSIDGNGFALKSYVHYSNNYFNAFWDGSRMTYGDGSSVNGYLPLTALDVCGHEITHGLTTKTSNLNYSNESGALNEAFSDIFGESIENYARNGHDWKLGKDFNYVIRDMSRPNDFSDPNTYKGLYWFTGTGDYGGVHTNSGVLNYWFVLLSDGGSGKNDNGYLYNIAGIGILKAQQIAFRTLTKYLISTSNYSNTRTYSIQSAIDLYGAASNEVTQVINAWNAVGVGGGTSSAGAMNPTTNSIMEMTPTTKAYPNPVIGITHLSYNDASGGKKNIEVVDMNGKVFLRKSTLLNKGMNELDLQTTSLKPGNYYIRVNNKKVTSIVKQ